jgi:ABC-2 type transport system permease protein
MPDEAPRAPQLRPYLAVIAVRFRTLLQYRGAALSSIGTQTFFGLVQAMILEAFYRSSAATHGFTLAQAMGYVWLRQATFAMQPYNLDRDVKAMVREGTIAYELVRPLDLYAFWYSRSLAWRAAPMTMRIVPMFIIATLVLPALGLGDIALGPPASLASGVLWVIAVGGALAVSAAVTTFMSITLLHTISGEGIGVLMVSVVALLSGMIIPLPLFPDWLQPLLRLLPFGALIDLPARVYTGDIPPAEAGWVILHQAFWAAALVLAGRALLRRGLRRVVLQGG